ncbi:hypothetical protein BN135_3421 [Cronobacter muytjensii 530]
MSKNNTILTFAAAALYGTLSAGQRAYNRNFRRRQARRRS